MEEVSLKTNNNILECEFNLYQHLLVIENGSQHKSKGRLFILEQWGVKLVKNRTETLPQTYMRLVETWQDSSGLGVALRPDLDLAIFVSTSS